MIVYEPPVQEWRFLFETFGYDSVHALPGYEDYDLDTVMALLEQAGAFARDKLLPLNRVGDEHGLKLENGEVTTPPGFKEAFDEYRKGGYLGITLPPEYGGGGAPHSLFAVFNEFWCSTNKAFSMCPGLTHGLVEALSAHGSEDLKQRFLPKLIDGTWTGTMCLTEPHAGTDLGIIRTKAEPDGDAFKLTGTKIWITFGEHDMADNIVHLVLAKLPGAAEGTRGISTFLVPKFLEDGTRNAITCGGLEHKMGIHGSPTCVMNLDGATGYLVGEEGKGMRSMFTMMNAARLIVGMEGIALSEVAAQTALAFAKDRRQGRSLDPAKRDRDEKADNILVHPDVRRLLLKARASTDGMRALTAFVALELDRMHKEPDEEKRQRADDLVQLLTPVIKSFCSERGFLNVSDAMQLTGGAGYTRDWPIEQHMRDVRIAMIYEGTNHVQALDLVGRKLPREGGRLYRNFATKVGGFLKKHAGSEVLGELHGELAGALDGLNQATQLLAERGMEDPEEAAAVASNYTTLFGLVATAWAWCEVLVAAFDTDRDDKERRRKLARFYFRHILSERHGLEKTIAAGKADIMAFDADEL